MRGIDNGDGPQGLQNREGADPSPKALQERPDTGELRLELIHTLTLALDNRNVIGGTNEDDLNYAFNNLPWDKIEGIEIQLGSKEESITVSRDNLADNLTAVLLLNGALRNPGTEQSRVETLQEPYNERIQFLISVLQAATADISEQ